MLQAILCSRQARRMEGASSRANAAPHPKQHQRPYNLQCSRPGAGRHAPAVPRSKRLLSDGGSNVLVYLAGHGGEDFMKFQDQEEIMGQVGTQRSAQQLGRAVFLGKPSAGWLVLASIHMPACRRSGARLDGVCVHGWVVTAPVLMQLGFALQQQHKHAQS